MSSHCPSCGAPIRANTNSCQYCHTKVDVDLKGVHQYTKVKPQNSRTCGKCKNVMSTINLHLDGDFYIEQCESCLSLFFDPGELNYLLDHTIQEPEIVDHLKLTQLLEDNPIPDHQVTYRPCPVCEKIMNRQNYAHKSGVIIDYCKQDGVFLDSGELQKLFLWKKAGGQEHSDKMKQWSQEDAQKRQARKVKAAFEADVKLSQDYQAGFSSYSRNDDIISNLNGLIQFIGKLFR